jgi:biotin operon repressor
MRYQLALEIHERIEEVLRLIKTGEYSTPALAEAVGVSIPTISRIVAALREHGHEIKAERNNTGWRYVLRPPLAHLANKGQASEGRGVPA